MEGRENASMTRRLTYAWILVTVAFLLGGTSLVAGELTQITEVSTHGPGADANYIGETPRGHITEGVINLGADPVGSFTNGSVTYDCATCYLGFGRTRYDFTVTVPTDVTLEVNDCCVEGDRFEARCNDRDLDEDGDGDLNNHEEDCIFGREVTNVPTGTFANLGTVTMAPGDWTVRVRDIQFQCGTVNPGCPAGYTMRISFGPPTGTPCAGLPSCFDPANGVGVGPACADESLPRDQPDDMLEAKLDALEPQIVALEQKLDVLQIQVETVIQLLDVIEAKLDDLGLPTPCDMSDPMTCDGDCPVAGEICMFGVGSGPCFCDTPPVPCDESDPATCDGDCSVATDICTIDASGTHCFCDTPPVPCDQSDPTTCDGDCPIAGEICMFGVGGGPCFCDTPPVPCDQSDPDICDGDCPIATQVCTNDPAGGPCFCQDSPPPCEQSNPMVCDGACPADEICTIDPFGGPCFCDTLPQPCDTSDPLVCDGTCPNPGDVCTPSTLVPPLPCSCEPPVQGFCEDPVALCIPCQLGTTCPATGIPCGPLPGCP